MAKKRKSETPPAASSLARSGSGLADTGASAAGMAAMSRSYYESKCALNTLPTEMPVDGMAARHVQATIVDQHELDFPEKLNTSSYVRVRVLVRRRRREFYPRRSASSRSRKRRTSL
jgi:hypothetical protein